MTKSSGTILAGKCRPAGRDACIARAGRSPPRTNVRSRIAQHVGAHGRPRNPFRLTVLALASRSRAAYATKARPAAADNRKRSPRSFAHRFSAPVAVQDWLGAFNDPQLDHLISRLWPTIRAWCRRWTGGAKHNHCLTRRGAGLAPSVSFNAQETRRRISAHDPSHHSIAGTTQWQGREGLDLSWDLDFWWPPGFVNPQARSQTPHALGRGRCAAGIERPRFAQAYIDLYRNNALADVAQRTEAQRQRILEITRRRVQAGLDTNVELREASGASCPRRVLSCSRRRLLPALDTHQTRCPVRSGRRGLCAGRAPIARSRRHPADTRGTAGRLLGHPPRRAGGARPDRSGPRRPGRSQGSVLS